MNKTPAARDADKFVLDLFESIDRQDWERLEAQLHDNVTYERPGYEPLIGKSAVMQFYHERRIILQGVHKVEQVVTKPPHIACWGSFVGRSKRGDDLSVRFADVYQVLEGRLWFRRTYFDSPAV